MNKIIISYIPEDDNENIHILKGIENTLLAAQMTNACIDLDILYNMYQDIIISSEYLINTDNILKEHINYISENENDILNHLKLDIRLNKNPIILIGYNSLNMETVKKMCPIITKSKEDGVLINIFIKKDDKNLKTISSHVIDIEENMNWEKIGSRLKEEYQNNLNKENNSIVSNLLESLGNVIYDKDISSLIKATSPLEFVLDINLEDEEDLDKSVKTISFTNINNCLTLEKISNDLVYISDEEGNRILLDEESINFLINNLINLLD